MPMRPHCDRCGKLIENSTRTWITMDSQVWHVQIKDDDTLLCLTCRVEILQKYITMLTTPEPESDIPF